MLIQPFNITSKGKLKLKTELDHLRTRYRQIVERLNNEVTSGDQEEVYYSVDLIEQVDVYNRINRLENVISHAKLMKFPSRQNKADIGSRIVIRNIDGGKHRLTLVSSVEADPFLDHISVESPLGQALLGKQPNDFIHVHTPGGDDTYVILRVT